MKRLLAITAHPDDESGGLGGTISLYVERGVEVGVICATRGEAGRHHGPANSREELAQLRAAEFRHACAFLGVAWNEILDYPDAGLNRVSLVDLGARLCGRIRRQRPHVVITFGLEGSYTGHADHAAIGHHASFAFHAASRSDWFPAAGEPWRPSKLYYLSGVAPMPPPKYPQVCFSPITTEIDVSAFMERKIAAFEHHKTQEPLFERLRVALGRIGPREQFHLAASRIAVPLAIEHDLFEGISDEDLA